MSSPCRVLYVDDDRDSCELVQAILHYSNLNYEVTTTESSKEAISLMSKQPFDLFILDYSLPDVSGVELCRYIRQHNPTKPIMFLTAMAYPIHRANGLAAGADEYLVKPNDIERVVKTVKRLLNKKSAQGCETSNKFQMNNRIY